MLMQNKWKVMHVASSTRHASLGETWMDRHRERERERVVPSRSQTRLLFVRYPTLLRQQAPEIAGRDDAPLGACRSYC